MGELSERVLGKGTALPERVLGKGRALSGGMFGKGRALPEKIVEFPSGNKSIILGVTALTDVVFIGFSETCGSSVVVFGSLP